MSIPLPGTEASTLRVQGTSTDWIKPIEDCVYDYLVDTWNIDRPLQDQLKQVNRQYTGVGAFHFWIVRKNTTRVRDALGSQIWAGTTTLQINVLMKRLKGERENDLDQMLREINRQLIEYQPHWIAGITHFDNIIEVPLVFGPEDEANPYQGTHIAVVTVDAKYWLQTNFNISSEPYNPGQHSAGQLSYKLNE